MRQTPFDTLHSFSTVVSALCWEMLAGGHMHEAPHCRLWCRLRLCWGSWRLLAA